MSNRTEFTTSDLRHASFLLARGFQFIGADPDHSRVKFSFACSPEEASVYFTPDDTVSCRHLFSAWQSLRTLIDDFRSGPSIKNRSRSSGTPTRSSHQW